MQRDFHYYCIGVLAKAAGFSSKDALTIAYASQYVDDATQGGRIPIKKSPNDIRIDPVRTAHKGLKVRSIFWSEQKKILISFHFIPPRFYEPPGWGFEYVTEPAQLKKTKKSEEFGIKFADTLLEEALKGKKECECWESMITDFELFRLCRIGIALHTYADTWAHQGFSGRKNEENEVIDIQVKKNNVMKLMKRKFKIKIPWKAGPRIGHAEAGFYPDYPFLVWEYTKKSTGELVPRNNTKEFLKAAETIYKKLSETQKTPYKKWNEIKKRIEKQLKYVGRDLEDRCENWRNNFYDFFDDLQFPEKFKYDKTDWWRTAFQVLKGDGHDWDDYYKGVEIRRKMIIKDDYFKSPFYHFHRAALLQRDFVLERLP